MDVSPSTIQVYKPQEAHLPDIENLITTINSFWRHEINELAHYLKQITQDIYSQSISPAVVILNIEGNKHLTQEDYKNIALSVNGCFNGIVPKLAALPDLEAAIYNKFDKVLSGRVNPALNEVVNIACALNQIGFSNVDDPIFKKIFQIMTVHFTRNHVDKEGEKIKKSHYAYPSKTYLTHRAWTIFALRKIKCPEQKKILYELAWDVVNHAKEITSFEISLVKIGLTHAGIQNTNINNCLRLLTNLKYPSFTVNEMVNTLWSHCYQKKDVDPSLIYRENKILYEKFKCKLISEMNILSVDQVVRIAWTVFYMNIRDDEFSEAVAANILEHLDELNGKEIVNITKRFCNSGSSLNPSLLKLLELFERKLNCPLFFTWKNISEVAYFVLIKYCEKSNEFDHGVFTKFLNVLVREALINRNLKKEDLYSIKTVLTILFENGEADEDLPIKKCLDLLELNKPEGKRLFNQSSRFHREVADTLSLIVKSPFENEHPFEDDYSLDIAFPDLKLAIEVDGYCHFDNHYNYIPKDLIKETLLKLRNWKLVRITSMEWEDAVDKRLTLIDKLSQVEGFKDLIEQNLKS